MIPQDKDEFKEYCLRKLGAPVIDINVDDDQVDDRIDEALLFYQTYHYDAIEQIAITYDITQEDIDNKYITIPSDIISIVQMVHDGSNMIKGGFGTNLWHGMKAIAYDIGFGSGACSGGTSYYTMMMNYLAELRFAFSVNHRLEFQYRNHHLNISMDWSKLSVGDVFAFEAYRIIDPEQYTDIWNDRALQEYATCLIGCQWGANLSKFDNVELPGGLTLDGDKIYDRYNDWKERLEEEFSLKWEEPVDFFVG
ncbi:MAG: hypothetical protein DRQ78_08985 [Epsilonproteobacteria bacterium]|nr:MAG: hypothetical protein DRQ78_08985 [Campylobacterota bacterium]